MEKRRVVVAVDESEESMYALSWCLHNIFSASSLPSTTLVLLYVLPPAPVYSSFPSPGYMFGNDVVAAMEEHSKSLVDSVMSRAEAIFTNSNLNIKVEKKIGRGDAKDVICSTVDKLGAQMLVMGCHGYGFFKRALLGSVSNDCAKRVKCPVVVVKHPHNS